MKIIAGVDGGGTKTSVEILGEKGEFIKRETFGSFNINSIGKEKFHDLLVEIFLFLKQEGECVSLCIGAAGISNAVVKQVLNEVIQEVSYTGKLFLKGDHEIALYGACNGVTGAILIAGTGSICTGIRKEEKTARAGGFGHLIDDAGSGYALGRDALAAVVRSFDGREENTVLTELIFREWDCKDIKELIAKVYSTTEKSHIASLSTVVEAACVQQDKIAMQIVEKNALELVKLVKSVYNQLETERLNLYLFGGLLTNETSLRKQFLKILACECPFVTLEKPVRDAAAGASLMALREWEKEKTDL